MVDDADSTEVAPAVVDEALVALRAELAEADALPLEERLAVLQRAEATIARALEGLDGL